MPEAAPGAVAVGLDGCPAGWVAAIALLRASRVRTAVTTFGSIAELDRWRHTQTPSPPVFIDMLIGLPAATGFRTCDLLARERLGPRRSCVFPAPDRGLLGARTYAELRAQVAARRERDPRARCVSAQGFGILRKIAEIDGYLRADRSRGEWLTEVHPELSFRTLAGADLPSKHTGLGKRRRFALLRPIFADLRRTLGAKPRGAAPDDVLDAFAVLWSGLRVLDGYAERLGDGERDDYGLPMRITV